MGEGKGAAKESGVTPSRDAHNWSVMSSDVDFGYGPFGPQLYKGRQSLLAWSRCSPPVQKIYFVDLRFFSKASTGASTVPSGIIGLSPNLMAELSGSFIPTFH